MKKPGNQSAKSGTVRKPVVSITKSGGRPHGEATQRRMLATIHETIVGLHRIGVATTSTMREFDELCLPPVAKLAGRDIAALRRREKVSQPVFAKYLNVSKSSVSQWETGEKNPDGAALKLLDLVKRKGLEILT